VGDQEVVVNRQQQSWHLQVSTEMSGWCVIMDLGADRNLVAPRELGLVVDGGFND
jgi:hypothetical protein